MLDEHGNHLMARYVSIAMDIATRIMRGEYREGQKIFGRSTLAGKYNVSPETIRRALTLLQDTGIVHVSPGVGVVVRSQKAAEAFLAECGQKEVLRGMQEKLHALLRQRDALNEEIDRLMHELLDYTMKMVGRLRRLDEIRVLPFSPLVGKSLAEVDFRSKTGATVLAIFRQGEEIYSPRADTVIQAGDVLLVVGHPENKEQLFSLVEPRQPES
ncbi:MAG: TrkA C-terminal domain-containing protein [Bacillota bacterium]|uniref:TrkA C-terminal domain-containing protein n=1 Tax=Desulfurispora thermophila TaxID=265470 RepID=UPI00037E6625